MCANFVLEAVNLDPVELGLRRVVRRIGKRWKNVERKSHWDEEEG